MRRPSDAVDPARIRYVTTTDAKSKCIGLSRTPICAIETLIGCVESVRYAGCDRFDSTRVRKTTSSIRVEYFFLKYGRINPRKLRTALNAESGSDIYYWISFDCFQAHFLKRECPDDGGACDGIPWTELLYTVGPHRGRWVLAATGLYSPEDDFLD